MAGCSDHYQEILKELKQLRQEVGFASKRLLTVEEAAHYCGISPKTIRNGLGPKAEKPFPVKAVKWGGRVLFEKADLDVYIDGLGAAAK